MKERKNPDIIHAKLFRSISGEVSHFPQGHTCGFIRFEGCNLKNENECPYCDTLNEQYKSLSFDDIRDWAIKTQKVDGMICMTGGEPLLRKPIINKLLSILDRDRVSIETNGTIDFFEYIGITNLVVDYKLHYMYGRIPSEYYLLTKNDFIKFVVGTVFDIQQAVSIQKRIQKENQEVNFAYSILIPEGTTNKELLSLSAKRIYNALVDNNLEASINLQIHKFLDFA